MPKIFVATLIAQLLFGNIIAQSFSSNPPEISAELRKNAVEFLRQTVKEIPNLKAEENRQFFTIETARLLWKYDEKEARAMLVNVASEIKQSIARSNTEYKNTVEEYRKKVRNNSNVNYGANGYYNSPNVAANAYYANAANRAVDEFPVEYFYNSKFYGDFQRTLSLRKRLLDNLADVEPVLAYQFLSETSKMIPAGMGQYEYPYYENILEKRIIGKLLEENEVEKAFEFARNLLTQDNPDDVVDVLIELYEKDEVKGSNLAEELLQRIKISTEVEEYQLISFFQSAVEYKEKTQPLLSDKSLRELAKLLGQSIVRKIDFQFYSNPAYYAAMIKEYAPREALRIMQKSKQKRRNNQSVYYSNMANYAANRVSSPYKAAANAMIPATNAAYNAAQAANMAVNAVTRANKAVNSSKPKNSKAKPAKTSPIIESVPVPQYEPTIDPKYELIQELRNGNFTPEERKKTVEQAKKYALAENTWGYARPDGFVRIVGELARFSLISADKEVADELMKEAEVYVRPEPKNYADYAAKLLLAGGYSNHHPDKSFAIMESMVTINEVIEGAIKFGKFIEFDPELFINDEVSAAYFLGERSGFLGISKEVEFRMFIHNLAKTDFQRTKGLADKFEKREAKFAAKMMILESLIGEESKY